MLVLSLEISFLNFVFFFKEFSFAAQDSNQVCFYVTCSLIFVRKDKILVLPVSLYGWKVSCFVKILHFEIIQNVLMAVRHCCYFTA